MKYTLYECDPEKNTECRKRSCLYKRNRKYGCSETKNPAFAKLGENGEPIVASEQHLERDGNAELEVNQKWQVSQNEDFSYRMTCPVCGFSIRNEAITIRRCCSRCGAVLAGSDMIIRICGSGEFIEEECDNKGNDYADDKHKDITTKAKPACSSFIRKIRKIIHAGG